MNSIDIRINSMPQLHEKVFVAPGAVVLGSVEIDEGSSIWYSAVIRGDMNNIRIGKFTNIQDNVSIHNDLSHECIIGNNVTVGHNAVLHGCTIGNNVIVGMGAIVLNGANISDNSIVAAGAIVTENKEFDSNVLIVGTPAKVARKLVTSEIEKIFENAQAYAEIAALYLNKNTKGEK